MRNYITYDSLATNPVTRLPISLCLDVSGSMCGTPINELNKGIRTFYSTIRNDEIAQMSAEINIVTFNSDVNSVRNFTTIIDEPRAPQLQASGLTCMGEGVNLSLDLLEKRKQQYKQAGVDYYQPILVLMTDGQPNGNSNELETAIKRTCQLVKNKKLTIIPIAIGPDADKAVLGRFSPDIRPLNLRNLKFEAFFRWLSASVSQVSRTMPENNFYIDINNVQDWGSL